MDAISTVVFLMYRLLVLLASCFKLTQYMYMKVVHEASKCIQGGKRFVFFCHYP